MAKSDTVAFVLPPSTQLSVLQQCVAHGVSAVTPSTVSDTIAALDAPAKQAGILLLNECGQSPGLDHVETVRLAAQVHAAGGKVKGYTSLTGSLATAEGLDNPLKAKLTWSPRGWLMHSWNPARYLDNGATVDRRIELCVKPRVTHGTVLCKTYLELLMAHGLILREHSHDILMVWFYVSSFTVHAAFSTHR